MENSSCAALRPGFIIYPLNLRDYVARLGLFIAYGIIRYVAGRTLFYMPKLWVLLHAPQMLSERQNRGFRRVV
jgi:hypothetical protein